MAEDQENVSKILAVLSHPLRREILRRLGEVGELSFTDLINFLSIDTGKLSFHIRSLQGLIEQTSTGKYILTRSGEHALRLVKDLETWSVEATMSKKESGLPLASFGRRAYAFLIDVGVLLSIFVVTATLAYVLSSFNPSVAFRLDFNTILSYVIVFWIYSTLLEGFAGQTLGKRIVGISVVRIDGKRMFYDNAAVRNLGKIFVLLPFDLLIGHGLNDKRFIRYFDKFAGTTVIDLRI